jgi:hypothetical protein
MDNAQTPTNPATAAIRQVGLRQFTDPGHIAMEQKMWGFNQFETSVAPPFWYIAVLARIIL